MLDGLKRLFAAPNSQLPDLLEPVAAWAEGRKYSLRLTGHDEGFVVEGRAATPPWRLEWGPSQRTYISGAELRLRAELGLPRELQVVLLNRSLQEAMERAVFEQYVEGVQTRIDDSTPPEMRWLVMFPRLSDAELGALRERFVALASAKSWMLQWLEGPLAAALAGLRVDPQTPFVLMLSRGRLTLRLALAEPAVRDLDIALRIFDVAVHEAQRVAEAVALANSEPPPED